MRQMFSKGQLEKLIKTTPIKEKDVYEALMKSENYTYFIFVDSNNDGIGIIYKNDENKLYGLEYLGSKEIMGNFLYDEEGEYFYIDEETQDEYVYVKGVDIFTQEFNLPKTNTTTISYGAMTNKQKEQIDKLLEIYNYLSLYHLFLKLNNVNISINVNLCGDDNYLYIYFTYASYLYEIKIDRTTKALTSTPKALFS